MPMHSTLLYPSFRRSPYLALPLLFGPRLAILSAGPTTELVTQGAVQNAVGETSGLGMLVRAVTEQLGLGRLQEFLSGGFTLAAFGLAGGVWEHLREYLQKQFIVSAVFESRDDSFSWILAWLNDHPMSRRTNSFSVATSLRPGERAEEGEGEGDGYDKLPRVVFLPSPGTHLFTFRGKLLWLSRERLTSSSLYSSDPTKERITIKALGRSRNVLEELVREARNHFAEKERCRTGVYSADQYGDWRRSRSRPIRALNTIMLDAGLKTSILDDAKEFLASEKYYADRGIPYRFVDEGYGRGGESGCRLK
ncbi:BCS1 N terminal-domain-containing protein [Blyttiomyces helicus]|uniref:BCS1 N terminal-domain-containing protein n=1 Tax=Blyttiomyces helicus TaxID=388810 RepID=A0A4P9W4E7_9FUNG|nr:BCS1 N terminal-domain-containing protein [Blyttiomyces helicus]|eukprot:RKO85560.1 BCS1 N terminal-domain-containing protein [Blyttiomyces helicus]